MSEIKENIKRFIENCNTHVKRDMREHELELHKEINSHLWFLEKTGFSKEEIDMATLMRVDNDNLLKYFLKIGFIW